VTHAPERRWFRFSLRTLFIAVTVIAVTTASIAWAVKTWLLPMDIFVHDTYLVIDWHVLVLPAALGVAGAILALIVATVLLVAIFRNSGKDDE
jgi:hypothetical protein